MQRRKNYTMNIWCITVVHLLGGRKGLKERDTERGSVCVHVRVSSEIVYLTSLYQKILTTHSGILPYILA